MFFFEFISNHIDVSKDKNIHGKKKEISNHLRIILLAIRLQRLVKSLPNHLVSAERITRYSLSKHYQSMSLSASESAALKMASRDINRIEHVFGLKGSEQEGYIMTKRFDKYYDMFAFWLEQLGKASSTNRRMHVLLRGLMQSIENGFRDDPITIPKLAQELKNEFGNRNLRDSKEPLEELFSNHTITSYLQLMDDEDEALKINMSADPLLMRLQSRHVVGDNADISINLALPGRIKSIFQHHITNQNTMTSNKLKIIAQAVKESHAWQNKAMHMVVPYILYREGAKGSFMLTLWNREDGSYQDIHVSEIQSIPTHCSSRFIPYNIPPTLWRQFMQITT